MTNTSITAFRQNIFDLVDQAVTYGEVIQVTTKNGNAILLSEQDYNGLLETLRLCSIPGMAESIKTAAAEPFTDSIPYDPTEAW